MNLNARVVLCLFSVLFLATGAFSQSAKSPLQGVWKVTEVTTTGPNASTNKNPQAGFMIFTGKYYSIVTINSDKPRPTLPQDVNTATAAQLRDAWGPFTGQTGTYEIKGSEVTMHPLAAKHPALTSSNFNLQTFKVEGNILTLVTKANQNGPAANPATRKLIRVE